MKKASIVFVSLLLICIITAATATQVFADTIFTADGFSYTQMYDNYSSLCGWDGGSDTLSIPNKLNNTKVKEIAGWTFSGRTDFSKLDFSKADYLDTIENMSFKNCSSIAGALTIPAQIKSLGLGAFQGCSSIDTLFYNSTASVAEQAFYQCSSLKSVVLADGVSSIERLAFAKCDLLEFVRIPESVTSINEYAFKDCPNAVIKCYRDSYAQQFAIDNGISYDLINLKLGDVNLDGVININDVTYIQMHDVQLITLGELEKKAADVNRDGEITIRDATLIQMYLANIITSF